MNIYVNILTRKYDDREIHKQGYMRRLKDPMSKESFVAAHHYKRARRKGNSGQKAIRKQHIEENIKLYKERMRNNLRNEEGGDSEEELEEKGNRESGTSKRDNEEDDDEESEEEKDNDEEKEKTENAEAVNKLDDEDSQEEEDQG